MSQTLFQTERLLIRPWARADREALWRIYADDEVTGFIPGLHLPHREGLGPRVEQLLALEYPPGQGVWAIVERATAETIGTLLLKQVPDGDGGRLDEVEVGWHLARSAWGRGYATEAGAGALRYGFDVLALPSIYAIADAGNVRSLAVMERLGMKRIGQIDRFYGEHAEAAVIHRADWRAPR